MLWLVVAAFYFEWNGRSLRGSLCLAGAILLKIFPVVLLGYFVWRKKWRFTAATLAWIAAGVFAVPPLLFGWQGNLALLHEWTAIVGKPALSIGRAESPLFEQLLDPGKLRNQSFEAVFFRILPHANATLLAIAVGIIMALVMLGIALRRRDNLLFLSAVICWMLLISPVAENHYFALLLLPVTTLVVLRRHPLAGAALIFFFVADSVGECFDPARTAGLLCWGTVGLWLALVILFARDPKNADDSPVHFKYSE
jgi:hypothetical protein